MFSRLARATLAVTLGALPLYTLRWSYGPLPTTLLENLILVTVAFYLIGRWRERSAVFHRTPLDVPIALLLVSGAISVAVAKDHRAALGLYRAFFIEPIALFYVMNGLFQTEQHFRSAMIGFGIGSSCFALLNIANFVWAFSQARISIGAPPSALYSSANEVAMYFEPAIALAAALIVVSSRPSDRWLGLAWGAFLVPALVLTLSRGAFLSLAIFVVFAIVSLSRAARKPLLIAICSGLAAFAGLLLLGSHTPVVIHRLSLKALEYTSVTRFELFGGTLLMIAQHPILGLGLGGYRYIFNGFPEIYPHNIWLAFWVETGLAGLVAFAYVIIWLLTRGWHALPATVGFQRVLLWGSLGALVMWATHGLFDTPYWKNDMSVEFWLIAALELAALRSWRSSAT